MKVKNLSELNDQLLSHVVGGNVATDFTVVYDRREKKQYSVEDDPESGRNLQMDNLDGLFL